MMLGELSDPGSFLKAVKIHEQISLVARFSFSEQQLSLLSVDENNQDQPGKQLYSSGALVSVFPVRGWTHGNIVTIVSRDLTLESATLERTFLQKERHHKCTFLLNEHNRVVLQCHYKPLGLLDTSVKPSGVNQVNELREVCEVREHVFQETLFDPLQQIPRHLNACELASRILKLGLRASEFGKLLGHFGCLGNDLTLSLELSSGLKFQLSSELSRVVVEATVGRSFVVSLEPTSFCVSPFVYTYMLSQLRAMIKDILHCSKTISLELDTNGLMKIESDTKRAFAFVSPFRAA